jgi:putative ABC transport system permease protein
VQFFSDLRYALRTLGRNPGFAAVVILILAIGIGANTAMFSIVDGVLLRPLAFNDPGRLVAIQEVVPRFATMAPTIPVNAMHFEEWRKSWQSAEQLAMLSSYGVNLTSGGEPERVIMGRVSSNLFSTLGVQPRLGRGFRAEEDRLGSDHVALLNHSLWQRRFHGDPGVLGQKILLDGLPYEVIGVLPAGLQVPKISQLQAMAFGAESPEIWKPFALRDEEKDAMGDFNYACIARLKPGATLSQALDELNAIQANISRDLPDHIELRAAIAPLQEQMTGRSRQGLLLLMLSVGTVLLIVCVNIANLLLARATGRSREFAVRAAIGASSARLLRQMLTESFLVAILGGALGLAIAAFAMELILANAPADLPRLNDVRLDGRVLGIGFALTLLSAAIFGLIPAWRSSRIDPQSGLRAGGRSATESRQSGRLRALLVAIETGLCTVCLVAAGLLLNSFVRLLHVDKGFDTERVITVDINLPATRYPDLAHRSDFLRNVIDASRALPGVSEVGVTNMLPLSGEGNNNMINLDGDTTPITQRPIADFRLINEDFFRAMKIPILQGRAIEAADRGRLVSVISAAAAKRVWPGVNPLGQHYHLGDPSAPSLEVIGVAGDVSAGSLQKQPNPTVYVPYWQRDQHRFSLLVRTSMDPASIAGAVRAQIRRLDPEMPVPQFRSMDEIVSASVAQRRFQLTLVLLFAGIALGLASLGIYGVVSYSVAQRRNELGIRMALGATGSDLRTLVLRQGLAPVVIGLATGLAGALALGRVLSGLLFGVSSTDPLTMSVVAAVLLMVAAAACYVPALRAIRSDPLVALRYE